MTQLTRDQAETLAQSIRTHAANLGVASLSDLEVFTRDELFDLENTLRLSARRVAPSRYGPDPTPAERVRAEVRAEPSGGWYLHENHQQTAATSVDDPSNPAIRAWALELLDGEHFQDLRLGKSQRLRVATYVARNAAYDISTSELLNALEDAIRDGV